MIKLIEYTLICFFLIGCSTKRNQEKETFTRKPEEKITPAKKAPTKTFAAFLQECNTQVNTRDAIPPTQLKHAAMKEPKVGTYQRSYQAHAQYVWEEFCKNLSQPQLNIQVAYTDASYQFYRKLLIIGDLFGTGETFALVGYSISDTTIKIHLLKKVQQKFKPFFESNVPNARTAGTPWHHIVDFVDLNGDKIKDLKIMAKITNLTGFSEQSQVWIYKGEKLLPLPKLTPPNDKQQGNKTW